MKLEKIYLFLLIILTGSVWGVLWSNLIFGISTLLLLLLIVKEYKISYSVSTLGNYLLFSVLIGFGLIIHYFLVPLKNDPIPYINLYVKFTIISFFVVYGKCKGINFLTLINSILKGLAIHALISFILSFVVIRYVFTISNVDIYTNTFAYLFFFNSSFELFGITFYRNQGIFWEPGILQIYMNILFFINTFIYKNRKFQILAVFLVISTYSTTGIAILLVQAFVIIFSKGISRKYKIILITIFIPIMIPLSIINFVEKRNDSGESDISSSVVRFYDVLEATNIVKRYPLIGIGLAHDTYVNVKSENNALLMNYSEEFIDAIIDRRSSNSILYFLMRFGIPITLLWLTLLYKQILIEDKKFLFFFIIFISLLSEPLLNYPFFLFLLASTIFGENRITFRNKNENYTACLTIKE